ncbi:ExbD/TolR family protein [Sphingomonas colocasiae]|uniref:Biopolymer transporter ExbD n=1 Tax=Sphingomonas colocasiae TaxID=1848973 RepID=A0ABS7PU47_9SPHN|nr:biopolymer transporter ExbD [Sphingomonas colocasiae]MBY8824876.1 biopolymer transporter ExbD [Sphingomonas colocasiae]
MRRLRPAVVAEPRPFQDLNITPLIDVMLVLLVMFILLIPVQFHEVPLDLPGKPGPAADRPIVRLSIGADDVVRWNGSAIGEDSLPGRFHGLVTDPAQPVLQIAADGAARYEIFDRTLAAAKKAGITRLGMVGNEQFVSAIAAR